MNNTIIIMNPFYLSNSELTPEFSVVDTDTYVICLRDDYISNEINNDKIKMFFDQNTTIEQLHATKDLISMIKMPFETTYTMTQNAILFVKGEILKDFASTECKFNDIESAYLMLESKHRDVKKWGKLYENNYNLFAYMRQKIFYTYNNLHNDEIENKLLSLISNITTNPICLDKTSCQKINKRFEERKFYFQSHIVESSQDDLAISTDIVNLCDRITELLTSKSLSEKEQLYLTCNLILNENYYKFIVNNSIILAHVHSIMNKYQLLFKYIWKYVWIYICNSDDETDIIFDIHCVNVLSTFGTKSNPNLTDGFYAKNTVIDLKEFQQRLNTFTSDVDIFMGMYWKNLVVCGEIMSVTLPVNNVNNDDLNIDIACNSSNVVEYVDRVLYLHKTISQNLIRSNAIIQRKDVKLVSKKRLTISISAKMLKAKCTKHEIPFTYDFVVANVVNLEVKHYFYKLYMSQKQCDDTSNFFKLGDKKNIPEFYEIVKLVDINNVNITIDSDKQSYITFTEILKYKIISEYLKYPIKIFHTNNIVNTLANFCLPCMRSYYDGENCYLMPSAVVAYITSINIDIKFAANTVNPCHIIDKYNRRGYSTVLNKFETEEFNSQFPLHNSKTKFNDQISLYNLIETDDVDNEVGTKNERLICDDIVDSEKNMIPMKKWLIDYAYDRINTIQKN